MSKKALFILTFFPRQLRRSFGMLEIFYNSNAVNALLVQVEAGDEGGKRRLCAYNPSERMNFKQPLAELIAQASFLSPVLMTSCTSRRVSLNRHLL